MARTSRSELGDRMLKAVRKLRRKSKRRADAVQTAFYRWVDRQDWTNRRSFVE
jgi:hypothetical protein